MGVQRLPSNAVAVVDDDESVRSSMTALLRSLGLEVRTFPSADAFLASGDRAFDCLITDVQMPGTDGLALQRIVRGWNEPIPTIVMTAFPERARDAALGAGAACFVAKPVDGDHLVSCLETILGGLD
jgi:FixJ family two-component response regulator